MSTHSMIGFIRRQSYQVKMIYCHFDGYPDGVGRELVRDFSAYKNVRGLVYTGHKETIPIRQLSNKPFDKVHITVDSPLEAIAYCKRRDDIAYLYLYSQKNKMWVYHQIDYIDDVTFYDLNKKIKVNLEIEVFNY